MELIQIYQCLCDPHRLRILHLLTRGPLCVCHLQEILDAPQAKVSQHLAYLRKRKMVTATREGNWMVYRLPSEPSRELEANLKCLQDCVTSHPVFQEDLSKLAQIMSSPDWSASPLKGSLC